MTRLKYTNMLVATYQSLKMVLAAPRLVLRLTRQSLDWSTQCQDNVTACDIVSSVWGSTIKVNIELTVITRRPRVMIEKLLKAMLNQNKQTNILENAWIFIVIIEINYADLISTYILLLAIMPPVWELACRPVQGYWFLMNFVWFWKNYSKIICYI